MRSQSTQVHCSNMGFLAHVRQVQPGKVYFKFELNWVIKEPLCYCYSFTFLTPLEKLILRTFLNNKRDKSIDLVLISVGLHSTFTVFN